MAVLAGRIPSINADKSFPSLLKLVLQEPGKDPPSVVHGCLSIAKAFVGHRLHVQVFDAYNVILIGYLSTKFMQVILPLICGVTIDLIDTVLCLFPVRRFWLALFGTLLPG